jgi:hypothetical protein
MLRAEASGESAVDRAGTGAAQRHRYCPAWIKYDGHVNQLRSLALKAVVVTTRTSFVAQRMNVVDTEPCQRHNPGGDRDWLQYTLGTLLLSVTLIAALCSIGYYAGLNAALITLGVVAGSGAVGTISVGSARGFMRGAANGCHAALLVLLVISAFCFYKGPKRDEGKSQRDEPPAMTHSAEEIIQAVQSLVPSARRLPQDVRIEDILSGHYVKNMLGLTGTEVYLFPDQTYIWLDWDDISPRTIFDQGTWVYRDGVVALLTDRTVSPGMEYLDRLYVPWIAPPGELFLPADDLSEQVFLLGAQTDGESVLTQANRGEEAAMAMSYWCYRQTETISRSDAATIKETLYADCAPEELQWRLMGGGYAKASVVLLAVSIMTIVIRSRNHRKLPRE